MKKIKNKIYMKNKKRISCKVWDLNPRVLSTNDLKSLPLDRSGNLATYVFNILSCFYILEIYIILLIYSTK